MENAAGCRCASSWRSFAAGAFVGAGLEYLFDPVRGRRRRHAVRERTAAAVRQPARRARRATRAAALRSVGQARGTLHRLHPPPPRQLDDAELAHKVESALGRVALVPKGRLNINAENGTVFLRGQLDDERLIDEVAVAVWKVEEVEKVVNLLHLPGTPPPHAG